jgi:hypothetical protein
METGVSTASFLVARYTRAITNFSFKLTKTIGEVHVFCEEKEVQSSSSPKFKFHVTFYA